MYLLLKRIRLIKFELLLQLSQLCRPVKTRYTQADLGTRLTWATMVLDGGSTVYGRSYRLPSGERQAHLVIQGNKKKSSR
ncbi:hypothetical protein O3G_MSEX000238 [Manduca sexta]|nr:hypothetical protein O3G_MSEX000238 [Manduca sexta]